MTRDDSNDDDDASVLSLLATSWLDDDDDGGDNLDAIDSSEANSTQLHTADGNDAHTHDDAVTPWLQSDDNDDSDNTSSYDTRGGASVDRMLTQQQQQERASSPAPARTDSSCMHSESDEDDETVADFPDDWADEYLAMDAQMSSSRSRLETTMVETPSAETTNEATSVAAPVISAAPVAPAAAVNRETETLGLNKLFGRAESSSSSFRDEIHLVEQATERAALAAMATSSEADASHSQPPASLLSVRQTTTRSFTAASSSSSPPELFQRAAESPDATSAARVHPIALALPLATTDKLLAPPLSPNALKRAASVYVTPTSTTRALMKRQDSLSSSSVSRSQMLWSSASDVASRRSSRLLDDWKRKEIWTDFKRAEEHVVTAPLVKKAVAADRNKDNDDDRVATVSASRLESLLLTLRAEINSSTRISSRGDKLTAVASVPTTSSTGAGQHTSSAASAAVESLTAGTVGTATSANSTCSLVAYEQLAHEKQLLADELESRIIASTADKELIRSLHDRVLTLERTAREHAALKDERARHDIDVQARVQTLADELARMATSETQLKHQTQQLFQQNQALQSDLLAKIAAEAAKVQKMAHLAAEKEALTLELSRHDAVVAARDREHREQLQQWTLRRVLKLQRLAHLRTAMAKLKTNAARETAARVLALAVIAHVHRRATDKTLATAFYKLRTHNARERHCTELVTLQRAVDSATQRARDVAVRSSMLQLAHVAATWRTRQLRNAFSVLEHHAQRGHTVEMRVERGCSALHTFMIGRERSHTQRAFTTWRACAELETLRLRDVSAQESEQALRDAKDCVFALSFDKTKLEEKLTRARTDAQRQTDALRESTAELTVVKHAFVATVVRDTERAWLRLVFTEWRLATHVRMAVTDLRQQTDDAERRAAERDKHAAAVDDYNRVLRSDLERFQFFSQDKRIAVDVLAKKLLREEERYRLLEERHAALDDARHTLQQQLAALRAYDDDAIDGLEVPAPVLALAKDLAVGSLHALFQRHATALPDLSSNNNNSSASDSPPRLALDALQRLFESSQLALEPTNGLQTPTTDALAVERLASHLPADVVARGLAFPDFVAAVHRVLLSVCSDSVDRTAHVKALWRSLLAAVDPTRWDAIGTRAVGGSGSDSASGPDHSSSDALSPWAAGRLSDDILQNQEKLLAVLEHETAVVERAVMEKASLKHTYPPSTAADAASSLTVASTFYEYQCDPMLPPEPCGPNPGSTVVVSAAAVPVTWYQTPQIRDLFLAFQTPLRHVLRKYARDTRRASHGDQFCLELPDVLQMLADLKLCPAYVTPAAVTAAFQSVCDCSGVMTPQAFTLFLGASALELYATSSAPARASVALSPREVLLAFFCDLGFLSTSDVPAPARICFVGIEVESILWSLFEYYAATSTTTTDNTSTAVAPLADDERVAMTSATFGKFMAEIAGVGSSSSSSADDVFDRVRRESRRSSSSATERWRMHFDDFYSAIAYVQEAQSQHAAAYATPGDAVRHWMQQTQ